MSTTTTTTSEKSRGQYLQKAKTLQTASTDLTPLASDEVRIAIRSTTICGSDVHYYTHFCNGSIQVREPLCLGHEAAGEVVAVGSGVPQANPDLKVGDFVALECGVPCGQCNYCSGGRYNICPALRFRSSGSKFPHYQGTLQELVDHPARWVHRLPVELSFEAGALLEPLAVAIHAGRRAGNATISPRRTCLILGAGAIGLLCAVAVRAEGCRDVVMVDIDKGRLDFALGHGFASVVYAVPPRKGQTLEEKLEIARQTSAEIAELRWPDGPAVGRVQTTFECTGVESCVQAGIYVSDLTPFNPAAFRAFNSLCSSGADANLYPSQATASGGCVVLVGMGIPNHTLPVSDLTGREINLVSTWRYADAYPRAIEIAKASVTGVPVDGNALPDVSKMISHRFQGLDKVQDALELAGKTRDADGNIVVKTVVNFQKLAAS